MKTEVLNSQKSIIHSSSQGKIQFSRALYRSHSLSRSSYWRWPFPDVSEQVYIQLLIEEAYSACSEPEPALRAAITEELRPKLQLETCLPFPWGHSQEDNRNETTLHVCDEHCIGVWHWNNYTHLLQWIKPLFAEKPLLNSASESKEQERTGGDQNYSPRLEPLSLEQNKTCPSCAPREGSGGIRLPQICLSVYKRGFCAFSGRDTVRPR